MTYDYNQPDFTIKQLMEICSSIAARKGWHDKDREFPEIVALLHSEVSEAFEAYRENLPVDGWFTKDHFPNEDPKPEGVPVELADILIRIFDYCGHVGIPLVEALGAKLTYNETRPYRHGGKLA